MSSTSPLHQLRIGVVLPSDPPQSGGAYEFQSSIFSEILRRNSVTSNCNLLRYVFISHEGCGNNSWHLSGNRAIDILTSPPKVRQSPFKRILRRLKLSNNSSGNETNIDFIHEQLLGKIDILWSLTPYVLVDSLPYIITVWDLQHRLQPFFPEVSASQTWEKREDHFSRLIRKAFLCVTGTERGADELSQFYGVDQERILINPFPCPPPLEIESHCSQKVLERIGLNDTVFILYPAQFWPHKNHVVALLALQKAREKGLYLKLVFTGSDKGCLKQIMAIALELGLLEHVIFTGFVNRETLTVLYKHTSALIFPSFFGPDNIPPLEAMSHRKPAIVADVPGAREQYRDAALFFNPNSPDDLATQLLYLFNDNNLRESLIRSGKICISSLSPGIYVDNIEKSIISSYFKLLSATSLLGNE